MFLLVFLFFWIILHFTFLYRISSRGIVLICHQVSNTIMPAGKRYCRLSVTLSLNLTPESKNCMWYNINFLPADHVMLFLFCIKVKESIKSNTNIFALAQLIVHGTPCQPTVQLCACVALMVSTFPCCFSWCWTVLVCSSLCLCWSHVASICLLIPCLCSFPSYVDDIMPVFILFLCWSCAPCWSRACVSRAHVDPVPMLIHSCTCCSCARVAQVDPVSLIPCMCWSRAHVHSDPVHMLFLCMCCSCVRVVLVHMVFSCTCCSRAPDVLVHVLFLS